MPDRLASRRISRRPLHCLTARRSSHPVGHILAVAGSTSGLEEGMGLAGRHPGDIAEVEGDRLA